MALAGAGERLPHIHGLSYSADGRQLLIPNHRGIAVYEQGRWTKTSGPEHDFMGYAATRNTLYGSGHPAADSDIVNPLGLMKSTDGGRTWKMMGLEGESDFHRLAASYAANALYLINTGINSRMNQIGMYLTVDEGVTWTYAEAEGLARDVNNLAVHPTDINMVVAGAPEGLYLSRDAAGKFERVAAIRGAVAAVAFDRDGQHIWVSQDAPNAALVRVGLKDGTQAEVFQSPALGDDVVSFIAMNPVRHDEIAVTTRKRNVFLSKDQGRTWKQLAKGGFALK